MRAVPRVPEASYKEKEDCPNCHTVLGGIGLCKKHTPYHTINHMGFARWAYWWAVKGGKIVVGSVPNIIKLVVLMVVVVLFALIINIGVEKQELVTCHKLQSYAQTYPLFYLTPIEKEMCDAHGISIDAPVRSVYE